MLSVDIKNVTALLYRGYAYEQLNKLPMAMTDYNKVITLDSKNAEAYYKRGNIYYTQKKYDKALEDLTNSVNYKPSPDAFYIRGLVYENTNMKTEACADFKSAAKLGHKEANKIVDKYCY